MGLRDAVVDVRQRVTEEQQKLARWYFEDHVKRLGLTEADIGGQSVEQLEDSLERINDAIKNPASFGTLKLTVSPEGGLFIAKSDVDYHFEVGILPILLERKKLILERLRSLKSEEKIDSLRDLIRKKVNDDEVKEAFEKQIDELEKEPSRLQEQLEEVEAERLAEQSKAQDKYDKHRIEVLKEKAQIWRSFLERESVATIVGSVLLVVLAVALIIAMFIDVKPTDIVKNGFLVILGYFFGQTVGKSQRPKE